MLDLDTDAVGVVVVDCVVTVFVLLEADAELALLQGTFGSQLIVDSGRLQITFHQKSVTYHGKNGL